VIACPAWGIEDSAFAPGVRDALEENRMLILEMRDVSGNLAAAEARNRFVMEHADALFTPHVAPGGMLDRLLKEQHDRQNQKQLGKTLWAIADQLRGAMNADDFRDYMLAFLFLRYLSDNYETAAKKELGRDYPEWRELPAPDSSNGSKMLPPLCPPLKIWYANNPGDIADFEKQMRRKVHYVIKPDHLWANIANLARTQNGDLLDTLRDGFKYIENESFESTFQGLFPRSTSAPTSSARPTPTRTASSATSSRKSPRDSPSSPPTSTPSATPTNT
jgi:hypothetical protein